MAARQRVDLIGLPAPAILAARALDLHDIDPLGQEVLAQAGAVAAGALDPDHNALAERSEPLREFDVAVQVGPDRQSAQDLAEPVQRPGEVLVLVRVHAHCDHRFLLIVDFGDVEAAGQSCVE